MQVQIITSVDGREVSRIEQGIEGSASAREEACHQVAQQVGRTLTEQALREVARQVARPTCCGRPMACHGHRRRRLVCLDGTIQVPRQRYRCGRCRRTNCPADRALEVGGHGVTAPLAKRVCQLGVLEPYAPLEQLLWDQHRVRLSHDTIRRLMQDAGGVAHQRQQAEVQRWQEQPVAQRTGPPAEQAPARIYISCDGITYCTHRRESDPQHPGQQRLVWQEMKVGCVYWQVADGRWQKVILWGRDPPEVFGAALYWLACRCGYHQAQERIFAADGAEWCWSIQAQYFEQATGVLDWYHLSEHLWETARVLEGPQAAAWVAPHLATLAEQGGAALARQLRLGLSRRRGGKRQRLARLLGYLETRLGQTHYPEYRAQGWQIGTGMIESTARQLVGCRLKGPGMHWSEAGAVAVTALRATWLNGVWDAFWQSQPLAA